jgi:hypothetical protein
VKVLLGNPFVSPKWLPGGEDVTRFPPVPLTNFAAIFPFAVSSPQED